MKLQSLSRLTWHAIDVLLPPRCLSCGAMAGSGGGLCAACFLRMSFLSADGCPCCGSPAGRQQDETVFHWPGPARSDSPAARTDPLCPVCKADPPHYARARSVLLYDDDSKGMILRFKHADATEAAPLFAGWMVRAAGPLLAEADLLLPVPLHRWRLFRRRYNQAALLCRQMSRQSGKPWLADTLQRCRATRSQGSFDHHHHGRSNRQKNVQDAFVVARGRERLEGRSVLLVDDVMTTGATVNECARVLLSAGACRVDVMTLARARLHHSLPPVYR